jgi:hypothetical protein
MHGATIKIMAVYYFEILEETNYTIRCKNPEKHHL